METTATKIDDYKIRITKTEDPVITEHEYDITFLIQQKKDIQKQKDEFDAARDRELKELDKLLEHCKNLEIKEKPEIISNVEPIKQPK